MITLILGFSITPTTNPMDNPNNQNPELTIFRNNTSMPLPFERSYWVIPGKLLAGEYPAAADPNEAYRKLLQENMQSIFPSGHCFI